MLTFTITALVAMLLPLSLPYPSNRIEVLYAEQTSDHTPPLAFDVVSIKQAPSNSLPLVPAFMRNKDVPIIGIQRMSAPVSLLIAYAYHMQMSELREATRAQPDWVKNRVYEITFRAAGNPDTDQVREMMRTMLRERFSLDLHEFTRQGTVNKIVLRKAGQAGPQLLKHVGTSNCTVQPQDSVGQKPSTSASGAPVCGISWYHLPGQVLHLSMVNASMTDFSRTLSGLGLSELGTYPLIDGTGLVGNYDISLTFRPTNNLLPSDMGVDSDNAPDLAHALADQLGLKVTLATGDVRVFAIDHIATPTPD